MKRGMSGAWRFTFLVFVLVMANYGTTTAQSAPSGSISPGRWLWMRDPRTAVLVVLGSVAVLGMGRKGLLHVRARRAVDRLAEPDVTAEEIESVGDHGREGLMELFRLLGTDADARKRAAAGRALATLWARDQLIAEEEKAIVTRGYTVNWKARRRYPRRMSRPIPILVEFGVPFLQSSGMGVRPDQLEWSYRIAGSERATLEVFSRWAEGPCVAAFEIDPADFPGKGPFKLALHAKVRTKRLTSCWELDLPHIPFTFEFDPILSLDALLALPDDIKAERIGAAVRLARNADEADRATDLGTEPTFLDLDDQFALREPPAVAITTPLPSDLAHDLAVEFDGIEGQFPAGAVVLSGQGVDGPREEKRFELGPIRRMEPDLIARPGERRMRVVLTADPQRGWADPDSRSLWPGTITTDWVTVRIVRR